jgi:hypothetical protein
MQKTAKHGGNMVKYATSGVPWPHELHAAEIHYRLQGNLSNLETTQHHFSLPARICPKTAERHFALLEEF